MLLLARSAPTIEQSFYERSTNCYFMSVSVGDWPRLSLKTMN